MCHIWTLPKDPSNTIYTFTHICSQRSVTDEGKHHVLVLDVLLQGRVRPVKRLLGLKGLLWGEHAHHTLVELQHAVGWGVMRNLKRVPRSWWGVDGVVCVVTGFRATAMQHAKVVIKCIQRVWGWGREEMGDINKNVNIMLVLVLVDGWGKNHIGDDSSCKYFIGMNIEHCNYTEWTNTHWN